MSTFNEAPDSGARNPDHPSHDPLYDLNIAYRSTERYLGELKTQLHESGTAVNDEIQQEIEQFEEDQRNLTAWLQTNAKNADRMQRNYFRAQCEGLSNRILALRDKIHTSNV